MNQPISTPTSGSQPHDVPANSLANEYPAPLEPLGEACEARQLSAAEHARTILDGTTVGTIATLTQDGSPWASVVTYATTNDGTPVFSLSTLALHGRNLAADSRISLAVPGPVPVGADPGDCGRVTISGCVIEPLGDARAAAERAYFAAVPSAEIYNAFGDFTLYAMDVTSVRWVGGFGRMSSVTLEQFATATPDPVAAKAEDAIAHLNADHSDALLAMSQTLAGHTDATTARCVRIDRYGMDLEVATPRGNAAARVGFAEPVERPGGLRAATIELAERARSAPAL